MLNSPSNPTGAAYREADYRPLLDVLSRHPHVWLMVDDIYEHIVYDDFRFVTPAAIEPGLRDRILTVNGVSKAYAMTGWRIGYAGGPSALIKRNGGRAEPVDVLPIVDQPGGGGRSPQRSQDIVRDHAGLSGRRDLVVSALNADRGITCRVRRRLLHLRQCAGLIGKKAEGIDQRARAKPLTCSSPSLLPARRVAVAQLNRHLVRFRQCAATGAGTAAIEVGRIVRSRSSPDRR